MKKKTKNKKRFQTSQSRLFIGVASLLAILIIIYLCSAFLLLGSVKKIDNTYVVTGKVTARQSGCSYEELKSDGTIGHDGLCDVGNSVSLDGIWISTGGGALTANPKYPFYISKVSGIHVNDQVEIRYIKDGKSTYGSTNCASCYIKKIGNSEPEPQQVIDAPRDFPIGK